MFQLTLIYFIDKTTILDSPSGIAPTIFISKAGPAQGVALTSVAANFGLGVSSWPSPFPRSNPIPLSWLLVDVSAQKTHLLHNTDHIYFSPLFSKTIDILFAILLAKSHPFITLARPKQQTCTLMKAFAPKGYRFSSQQHFGLQPLVADKAQCPRPPGGGTEGAVCKASLRIQGNRVSISSPFSFQRASRDIWIHHPPSPNSLCGGGAEILFSQPSSINLINNTEGGEWDISWFSCIACRFSPLHGVQTLQTTGCCPSPKDLFHSSQ